MLRIIVTSSSLKMLKWRLNAFLLQLSSKLVQEYVLVCVRYKTHRDKNSGLIHPLCCFSQVYGGCCNFKYYQWSRSSRVVQRQNYDWNCQGSRFLWCWLFKTVESTKVSSFQLEFAQQLWKYSRQLEKSVSPELEVKKNCLQTHKFCLSVAVAEDEVRFLWNKS